MALTEEQIRFLRDMLRCSQIVRSRSNPELTIGTAWEQMLQECLCESPDDWRLLTERFSETELRSLYNVFRGQEAALEFYHRGVASGSAEEFAKLVQGFGGDAKLMRELFEAYGG